MTAPTGVCPFPHGMTSTNTAPIHTEMLVDTMSADNFEMQLEADVEVEVEVEDISTPLEEMMDQISGDDSDNNDEEIDYIALANEVEKWLALEELQRNQ